MVPHAPSLAATAYGEIGKQFFAPGQPFVQKQGRPIKSMVLPAAGASWISKQSLELGCGARFAKWHK